ncbi:MAG: carbamoyltransferase HypF [Verrucomicrobia bacterium]|nr:carbamoyltransferase HypF [Verrucomicrobiota bacterium]
MPAPPSNRARLRLAIRGAVQGVGFRPFVHRLATVLGLVGWVNNSSAGVGVEVEGPRAALEAFLLRLGAEKPPHSFIQSLESSWLDPVGHEGFEIRPSDPAGGTTALILPDLATCPDCLREIFDPSNRRYGYPFTNCTNCGPRFSILEALPYDRPNTSMRRFTMCPACQAEYDDPTNRRFHAQPNACPVCGPRVELWDRHGHRVCGGGRAWLTETARAIRAGKIVAVKGLGGFHLVVTAHDDDAVRRLRQRKRREEKPLAVMMPSLAQAKAHCEVSPLEERLLTSPEAPIVLLRRHPGSSVAPSVAPGNPQLGVMLPYTPLHHLLMAELGFAVVATSGNLSDEPICTDEREALERLGDIADLFLVHNRPIVRHVDDSIVRVMLGRELVLRRARGYAPLPVQMSPPLLRALAPHPPGKPEAPPPTPVAPGEDAPGGGSSILAVGAHLKNSVALSVGTQVFISQHIGDLETEQAWEAFRRVIADFQRLYHVAPTRIACDLHPDYLSTRHAQGSGLPVTGVQHHVAHVLSCLAENELEPPVLGVAWDGTGYGEDGTVWGGEFFRVSAGAVDRVAHFRTFRLPGGDQAVKEPRRSALGWLFERLGASVFDHGELAPVRACTEAERVALRTMLRQGVHAPVTSSVGRLFDAVASVIGLRQQARFEGQAAMELEFALGAEATDEHYPVLLVEKAADSRDPSRPMLLVDWAPMLDAILEETRREVAAGRIAARFHNTLAESVVEVARRVGEERVALSGGCFQNRYLTETTVRRLAAAGFRPYWHQRVPPNDGGIALGQVVAARIQTR